MQPENAHLYTLVPGRMVGVAAVEGRSPDADGIEIAFALDHSQEIIASVVGDYV